MKNIAEKWSNLLKYEVNVAIIKLENFTIRFRGVFGLNP